MQNYIWFEIPTGEYTHIFYSYNSHEVQFFYDSDVIINLNNHIILISCTFYCINNNMILIWCPSYIILISEWCDSYMIRMIWELYDALFYHLISAQSYKNHIILIWELYVAKFPVYKLILGVTQTRCMRMVNFLSHL